jgi:hypothetical protein
VRATREQANPEQLTQRLAELMQRVAELSEYVRQNGSKANREQDADFGEHESPKPIELLTESGFTIVRAWEAPGSPAVTDNSFRFIVSEPQNTQREVTVRVADYLITDTATRTRERIHALSSFWICCAERHLANYLTEHSDFPEDNRLIVDGLDCEEVMSAIRWGKYQIWD